MEGLVGVAVAGCQSGGRCNEVRNSRRELPCVGRRTQNVERSCSKKSGRDKSSTAQVLSIPCTVEGKHKGDRSRSPQCDDDSCKVKPNVVSKSQPLIDRAGFATAAGTVDVAEEMQSVILALCAPSLITSQRSQRKRSQKSACAYLVSGGTSQGGVMGVSNLSNPVCSPIYDSPERKNHNKVEKTEVVSVYENVLNRDWLSDENRSIDNLYFRKARQRSDRKVDHCSFASKLSSKQSKRKQFRRSPPVVDMDKAMKRCQKMSKGSSFGKRVASDFYGVHTRSSRKGKKQGLDRVCHDNNGPKEVSNRDWLSDDDIHSMSTPDCRKTRRHPDQNVNHCSAVNKSSCRQSKEENFDRTRGVGADPHKDVLNVDWSLDTSPFAADLGKTKKRHQKINRGNDVVKLMVSGYFSGVHEKSIRKGKTQGVDGMILVGQDVPEEDMNRDWLSDENYSISNVNSMKTRQNSDRNVDYCSNSKDLSWEQSRDQTFDRTSSIGADLYNDILNIDWSEDNSPPADDFGKTKKRSGVSKNVASGGISGVHELPCWKRKRHEVDKMICVDDHEVHKKIAKFDSTSKIQYCENDCPQKKNKQQKGSNTCAGVIVDTKDHIPAVYESSLKKKKQRAKFGGNMRKDDVNVDIAPFRAELPKKNKKEERIGMTTKVGMFEQRSVVAMDTASAVSSHDTDSGKERPITCKKADANALGQRVIADKDWVPPVSAYGLIQEELYTDPWKVLVACMLLNRTTGAQMRQVIWDLFNLCPTPEETVVIETEKIEEIIRRLGLQHKRAQMIQRFCREYLGKDWTNVTELHGIGKYATDAYAIFCEGRWREVKPNDHKLIEYWQYLHETDGLGYGFKDDRKAHCQGNKLNLRLAF